MCTELRKHPSFKTYHLVYRKTYWRGSRSLRRLLRRPPSFPATFPATTFFSGNFSGAFSFSHTSLSIDFYQDQQPWRSLRRLRLLWRPPSSPAAFPATHYLTFWLFRRIFLLSYLSLYRFLPRSATMKVAEEDGSLRREGMKVAGGKEWRKRKREDGGCRRRSPERMMVAGEDEVAGKVAGVVVTGW